MAEPSLSSMPAASGTDDKAKAAMAALAAVVSAESASRAKAERPAATPLAAPRRWQALLAPLARQHGAKAGIALAAVVAVWGLMAYQSYHTMNVAYAAIADARLADQAAERKQGQSLERLAAQLDKVAARVETLAQRPRGEDAKAVKAGLERVEGGLDRVKQDVAGRIAPLADQLGQADKTQKDMGSKLAQIMDRLDRLEKSDRASVTGSLPAAAPVPSPKPDAIKADAAKPDAGKVAASVPPATRPDILRGWTVREVSGSTALIENRGELYEVTRGATVPGLGRIESFEKQGNDWTVVTSQGRIAGR